MQVPQAKQKGHVDRLRAEEKWQSRARLTETSFGFLEASSQLPVIPQKKKADKVEDWHFQKPQVCTHLILHVKHPWKWINLDQYS